MVAVCGHYTPTGLHSRSLQSGVSFISLGVFAEFPLENFYEAAILKYHLRHLFVVPGTVPLGEVKRSRAKLIPYQWIFRNGSKWKPFVMGNPFLIEFMHLVSLRGLGITLLSHQKTSVEPACPITVQI